ncbi:hypothetical protein Verru16b_03427 [Lacunisphaera limnophila]|uniref:PilZ domain-containing protein n=1 Tax=Lacunisphaera limnophila TaxID=1838286 RepID=A0A1D8AZK6_9BACT|nr:PilZ domain-containing protein [Lacunisphaera limnophila]AOS46326.1 hypothetical protein Verru16b_03427 [Lacunisphaera limnophila]
MLLFRRIFNFEKAKVDKMEQRLNQRYTPGAAFPLQAWLVTGGREWPARVLDLSGNGLGLLVEAAAKPEAGLPARVRVAMGHHQQVLETKLVQVRPEPKGLYCGLGLVFREFPGQKIWLQLIQPIAIGQSLRAVPAERVVQNEPQFIKQVFRGDEQSMLTVWLEKSFGTPLHSFEFEMQGYFCRADAQSGTLEAYTLEEGDSHKGKISNPVFDSSGDLKAEIRQLFRWILPNLSPAVPDDVRAFLQRFAT